ncbi:MAG: GHKL domain-containing protein [Ruminococcus sp.]|nr:GHKL domain-containing protein [Ruminococcus sp.]
MFTKLRKKFVLIVVLSLFAVEAVIIGTISAINYYNLNQRADALLQMISDGGGKFDVDRAIRYAQPPDNESHQDSDTPPDPPSDKKKRSNLSKLIGAGDVDIETRYSTRYFYVRTDHENKIKLINTSHIAALSSKETRSFAAEILETGKETGFINGYKFLVTTTDSGKLLVVIDFNADITTAMNFFYVSCLVGICSLIVVTVLVALLSKRAIKPMIENMERQKRFITDAGHEIKTPLAIISANTEVIEMTSGESEWTQSIRHQTTRLSELVQRLLKLAKMEDKVRQDMVITEFDISEAVADTAEPFVTLAKSKNKTLSLNIADGLKLKGDEAQIRELTSILTENAVKYADEGSEIKLTLAKKGKETVITVFNKGEPIAAESLPRLFDRFYREDSSRTRDTGGSGIGLSIAKAIVTAHKGSISAKNTDGGILFTAAVRSVSQTKE